MEDEDDFKYFDEWDYTVFGFLLLLSALVGVYFAFFAKQKQNTITEYLLGGKKMGIFPISMSLIASYTSGITIIGLPSEVYTYGSQLGVLVIAESLTAIVMAFVFIPVFYKLQIFSSYEYFNRRFGPSVRTMGSCLFLCKMMLYIPIVIYVPALAFAKVSGFSIDILIPTICIVCIFYTSLGGIKAVVWTDTLQMMMMVLGLITVAVMGTYDVGSVATVFQRAEESDRLDFFNFSWDPTIRHTFWNVMIGKFFFHMSTCTINQAMVQRCLAMPTLNKARLAIVIFEAGVFFIVAVSFYTGWLIFAAFHNCDPVLSGRIGKADEILPYFVMKITSHVPCLPGIFVSGVFSAALSTMSTGLNSMCGILLEDFIKPFYKKPISEARASLVMKIITVIIGIICTTLAFVVEQLGGIIQVSGSLSGITAGILLGMFILGMLFPWANSKGAIIGGLVGAVLMSWMSFGALAAQRSKQIVFPKKFTTIDGCSNATIAAISKRTSVLVNNTINVEVPFYIHRISYLYYPVIGMVTVVVVGMLVSWCTGFNDPADLSPDVISPAIRRFIKPKSQPTKLKVMKPVR